MLRCAERAKMTLPGKDRSIRDTALAYQGEQ
jgi:hypothetical protein